MVGCAISADGQTIVSASWDHTLKVWDAASGTERHTLRGHTASVSGCALSADGQTIVSASHDQTLKVWDAASGHVRCTLYVDALLNDCACSATVQRIIAVGGPYVYMLLLRG